MRLQTVYKTLLKQHGHQDWWPGDTPFEIMVGAILTQNTSWRNVEQAIDNLKANHALDPRKILATRTAMLAQWLKPSGYFNIKTQRLRNFCKWYLESGGYETLRRMQTAHLRKALLSVNGVGLETADDILLYAFKRKVFVIDAYTRRMFSRLGLVDPDWHYEQLRQYFEDKLHRESVALFCQYHALIVMHGKELCRPKPRCDDCLLRSRCGASEAGVNRLRAVRAADRNGRGA
ncbi:MAG: endonuclease [Granulosicoccaceae bacterium]|jgi:endonuclease-3 related protein